MTSNPPLLLLKGALVFINAGEPCVGTFIVCPFLGFLRSALCLGQFQPPLLAKPWCLFLRPMLRQALIRRSSRSSPPGTSHAHFDQTPSRAAVAQIARDASAPKRLPPHQAKTRIGRLDFPERLVHVHAAITIWHADNTRLFCSPTVSA